MALNEHRETARIIVERAGVTSNQTEYKFLIRLFSEELDRVTRPKIGTTGTYIKCWNCDSQRLDKFAVCPNCGASPRP